MAITSRLEGMALRLEVQIIAFVIALDGRTLSEVVFARSDPLPREVPDVSWSPGILGKASMR